MDEPTPPSKPCKTCGRSEPEVRLRLSEFDGVSVRRSVCWECEKKFRRDKRKAARLGKSKNLLRILMVPDCHHGNVYESAWGVLLRAGMHFKPDIIVIMGDFADGESLSLHEPDEVGGRDFKDEVGLVMAALTQLDNLGASRKVYLEGNHEQRLSRYLARRAPAVYRSMSLPDILGLKERGWEWVPYRTSIKIGKLHLTHDTGSAGMNAHRASAKAFMGSCVIGHTHRMSYEVVGRFDDKPYVSAMFGWLGDPKLAAKYIHEAKSADWVHGFGVGYMEPNGVVHLQPVPIVDGRCVIQGTLID